jgi:hypothetical protein
MVEWVELADTMLPRRRDDEGSEGELRPEDGGALFLFSRDGSAVRAPLVSAVDESPAHRHPWDRPFGLRTGWLTKRLIEFPGRVR